MKIPRKCHSHIAQPTRVTKEGEMRNKQRHHKRHIWNHRRTKHNYGETHLNKKKKKKKKKKIIIIIIHCDETKQKAQWRSETKTPQRSENKTTWSCKLDGYACQTPLLILKCTIFYKRITCYMYDQSFMALSTEYVYVLFFFWTLDWKMHQA